MFSMNSILYKSQSTSIETRCWTSTARSLCRDGGDGMRLKNVLHLWHNIEPLDLAARLICDVKIAQTTIAGGLILIKPAHLCVGRISSGTKDSRLRSTTVCKLGVLRPVPFRDRCSKCADLSAIYRDIFPNSAYGDHISNYFQIKVPTSFIDTWMQLV